MLSILTQAQVMGGISYRTRTRNMGNEFAYTLHSGGMVRMIIWHLSGRMCAANRSLGLCRFICRTLETRVSLSYLLMTIK